MKGGDDDRLANLAIPVAKKREKIPPAAVFHKGKHEAQFDERIHYQSESCKEAQGSDPPRRSLPSRDSYRSQCAKVILHTKNLEEIPLPLVIDDSNSTVRGRYEVTLGEGPTSGYHFAMLIPLLAEMKLTSHRYSCLDFDPSPGVAPLFVG